MSRWTAASQRLRVAARTRAEARWIGERGIKRSTIVGAEGNPLGVLCAPANFHDSPLLGETLQSMDGSLELPEHASVHLDRAYDSNLARELLAESGLASVISKKGNQLPCKPQEVGWSSDQLLDQCP